MTDLRLGPRQREILEGWGSVVAESPAGAGYDLGNLDRSERFRDRLETFVQSPTEERFEACWSPEHLDAALVGGAPYVRNAWDGSHTDLAALLDTIRSASTYDAAWEESFPGTFAVWEVFTRTHPECVVLTTQTVEGLRRFGFDRPQSFGDARESVDEFAGQYAELVGHATAGTPHEVHVTEEIETLLRLLSNVSDAELQQEVTGERRALYRPLITDGPGYWGGKVAFGSLDALLDEYVLARESGRLDEEDTDGWGGDHWETWKWAYVHDYVHVEVLPDYTITTLKPGEVVEFLDRLDRAVGLSDKIPTFLLGGKWGGILWNAFVEYSQEHPDRAATVLSDLFDESLYIATRLDGFQAVYGHLTDSPGQLLSLVTFLLLSVYPDHYVMYKYGKFSTFFEATSDYSVGSGFDTDQYWILNEACRHLVDRLEERDVDASMLDAHSLIWVFGNTGFP